MAALSACVLIGACASTSGTKSSGASSPAPSTRTAGVNLAGYPPAFRQGYGDGCATAAGRLTRDEVRFKADVQYAWGWRDGRDICGRRD